MKIHFGCYLKNKENEIINYFVPLLKYPNGDMFLDFTLLCFDTLLLNGLCIVFIFMLL
jgi:hypothetical protein